MKNKRLLIVDALNFFIRSYIVNPSISTNGNPIGGIYGTLKSLQKVVRDVNPDEIIFAWDGEGGSKKKKLINKDYKEGRKPIVRLNRNIIGSLSEDQENNNMNWQQIRLYEYLNLMPIMQFLESGVEADDIIATIVKHDKYLNWHIVILSADKDFIQLCDEKTILYRPMQEDIKTVKNVVKEFGIHPTNFALARSMDGDKSDNIRGVDGVGLKSITKYFPFLVESKTYLIDDLESFCKEKLKEEKVKTNFYQKIVDNVELIKTNYSLMQLYSPNLSVQVAQKTRNILNDFVPDLNQTEIRKMFTQDCFPVLDTTFDEMYSTFRRIIRDFNEKQS